LSTDPVPRPTETVALARRWLSSWGLVDEVPSVQPAPLELSQLADFAGAQISATWHDAHSEHELSIRPLQAESLHAAGWVIACQLDKAVPTLGDWAASMGDTTGQPRERIEVAGVFTPPGRGLVRRYEPTELLVRQVRGCASWTCSPGPVPNPLVAERAPVAAERATDTAETSVDLEPGQCLFVPRGHWHATHSDEGCTALVASLRSLTWVDLLDRWFAEVAADEYREPAHGIYAASAPAIKQRLAALLERDGLPVELEQLWKHLEASLS